MRVGERARDNVERVAFLLDHALEGAFEISRRFDWDVREANSERLRSCIGVPELQLVIIPSVVEKGDSPEPGNQALQQPEPFADKIRRDTTETGRFAAGTPQAAHEFLERIATDHDDRNIFALLFRGQQRQFSRDEKTRPS